jgi:hypothetical protein
MFTAPGQPKIEAFPESETKFFFKIFDAQVTFVRDEKGAVTELLFEVNGRTLRAKKINKVAANGASSGWRRAHNHFEDR